MTIETETPREKESMGIDPYERNWMAFSVALLVVFMSTVAVAAFGLGFQLPDEHDRVDPRTVTESGPFSEPGLVEVAPGKYEAWVVAQTFKFEPRELVVPVGAEVDIYVTSIDVQHGFKATDTNINMQIVPGQVSKLSYTFDRVGEFPYICTEYCGIGHAAMAGVVKVVPENEFEGGGE